ncbi:hypothetical protein [Paenibacillus aestuarii]|uniref:Uncharacterized protein n=1 Tax=Paenibacillus aestuarii TaxID=516965 RepID=A0ABW0KJU5_9BACL|nr:hypothetical protein [Paenibacillus aestuarii]
MLFTWWREQRGNPAAGRIKGHRWTRRYLRGGASSRAPCLT